MNLTYTLTHAFPGSIWSCSGSTAEEQYASLSWFGPGEKPSFQEIEAAWVKLQSKKGWENVQAFMACFTMTEIAAVSLSTDSTIAALRLTLSTWLGRVEVPDLRVQTGLNKMVELGIISSDRKAEIEAQAT